MEYYIYEVFIDDKYNNLIDKKSNYIRLKSNNSEIDYSYNLPKRDRPELKGFSFSRKSFYLLNKNDYDMITLKEHIENKPLYDVDCDFKNKFNYNINYTKDNEFDINLSVNDTNLEKGIYNINCFAIYKSEQINIPDMFVYYLDENVFSDFNTEISEMDLNESSQENISKDSNSFFNKILEKLNKLFE